MKNMLHITICDDEPSQLSLLETYVRSWMEQEKIEAEIFCCRNADQFFFQWEEKRNTDLLLLDIEMPGMNGVDLAKKLRKMGESLQILFITGNAEYALDGYEVEAVSYLLKPVKEEQLISCLNRAKARLGREEPAILLEAAGELSRVKIRDISFLESAGHDTLVYLNREENGSKTAGRSGTATVQQSNPAETEILRSKMGIQKLEQLLREQSDSFYKIHRSYLINLMHVKKITRKEVVMEHDRIVPIARGKWEQLNQAYLTYYRRKQEK